jgi:hypothetical protein
MHVKCIRLQTPSLYLAILQDAASSYVVQAFIALSCNKTGNVVLPSAFSCPTIGYIYFVHSSVSMSPSQGIHGGIRAALVDRCFIYILFITRSTFIELAHANMNKLKTDQNKFPLGCFHHSACFSTSFLRPCSLSLLFC